MDRARQVRLLELVLLAHVDDHGTVAVPVGVAIVDVLRVHLADLLLDLAEYLCARSHYFTKNSGRDKKPGRGRPANRPSFSAEAPGQILPDRSLTNSFGPAMRADMGWRPHFSGWAHSDQWTDHA